MIEQTARGGDDNMRGMLQGISLGAKGLPAAEHQNLDVRQAARQAAQLAGDLIGQLAGRHNTSDWVSKRAGSICCSRPSPNAAVFPLPVFACTRTSFPARIAGRAAA